MLKPIEAALQPGKNVLTVAMFRLGRMARVGCRLEVTDGELEAHMPLGEAMSWETRVGVEHELASPRLAQDIFYPGDDVGLQVGVAPSVETSLRTQLLSESGQVLHEITPAAAGPASFCTGQELDSEPSPRRARLSPRARTAPTLIQGILRLMVWEREQRRLSAEINACMKDTVLGFKYWVDEPGDTVMYMGSEKHRLLFHVAEWMAGQLYPTEEFTNSRQRGLYHATKGRTYITEWLRQRPDYWSGHTAVPRVIQVRNVLSLTWRLSEYAWMTHCFFEQARFDEVRLKDKWAFARLGRSYVGIYSQHGLTLGEQGPYAGRELQCTAPENTWLVECGREADWGTFDAFVEALNAAQIKENGSEIAYNSPSVGRFVTGWEVQPMIDSQPIPLRRYPLVDSPWAHDNFGSGELIIRYGDEIYELWFNQ